MKLLLALALLILAAVPQNAQTPGEKVQKMADLIMTSYNGKEYATIEQQFNTEMKAALSLAKLKEFLDSVHAEFGKLGKLGAPKFLAPSVAVFPAEFERAKMELLVAVDAEGKIAGLLVAPPTPIKPPNTGRNKTPLGLPFKGEWLVFWGGDTSAQNYHQENAVQRFAFDILKVDAKGATHQGDGRKNEDYYAFGQDVLAVADGTVAMVIDGVPDNVPGIMNQLMAVGNAVMIRHSDGEVSVYAHFRYQTIRVKVGDRVKRGQLIGLCGNSGNSSEAHIHYQLQGTLLFEAENSMKVFFEKITVRREGRPEIKSEYSPVKGDIVSQN